jgi:hypothetical protein
MVSWLQQVSAAFFILLATLCCAYLEGCSTALLMYVLTALICIYDLHRYKARQQQRSSAAANGTAAGGAAGPLPVLASACPGEHVAAACSSSLHQQQQQEQQQQEYGACSAGLCRNAMTLAVDLAVPSSS